MSYERTERISEQIRKIVSHIIHDELKDPRVSKMVSITKVKVSRDIRHAKIYVSVLGGEEDKNNTMEGLDRACGFIRKELGRFLRIRYIPELHFILDPSIEYSVRIAQKLNDINKQREEH